MPTAAPTLNPLPLILAANNSMPAAAPAPAEAAASPGRDLRVAQLGREARDGSIEAFEELIASFEGRIYGFLYRQLGNAHDAQDLTQETFVRAWKAIARFDPEREFATWIFVIARRAAANHFRARRPHDELSEDLPSGGVAPGESAEADDEAAALWNAARQLKPSYYEALWLRYAEGFSVAETARVMGLTVIHTKVILHRARKEMQRCLKGKNI
jgi:RNA polymerase sigma-70 factor (ECF subfamily)